MMCRSDYRFNNYKLCYTTALAFFFAFAESLMPHPIPFLRYGFANIALLMASKILLFRDYLLLIMFKAVLGSFFAGNIFTPFFLISLGCSLVVYIIVYALKNTKSISFIGISIVSSFLYNMLQSYFFYNFILGKASLQVLSIYVLFGNLSGLFTGIVSNMLYETYRENVLNEPVSSGLSDKISMNYFSFGTILKILLVVALIFIFNLLTPRGNVMCKFLCFPITKDALDISIMRSLLIIVSYILSIFFCIYYKPKSNSIRSVFQIYSQFVVKFYQIKKCKSLSGIVSNLKEVLSVS